MANLKASEIDAFVRKPGKKYSVILVYGPDTGRISERCNALVKALTKNPDDAFQLTKIDAENLGDPGRINEEANTLGLFGDARTIWVRVGSKNIVSAIEPLLDTIPQNPVIIEAGDLPARHALRNAIEKCAHAVALPCYMDEARDLPALLDDVLKASNLSIDTDARKFMLGALGADRLLSRREIEKVALYAHGQKSISLADVEAIMSDASPLASDMLADSVFTGDSATADDVLSRSLKEGQDAGVLIGSVLRHALTLLDARMAMDRGASMMEVEKKARIFFKRSAAFQRQMQIWTASALESTIATLGEAQANCRKFSHLQASIASRACLTIALAARRGR